MQNLARLGCLLVVGLMVGCGDKASSSTSSASPATSSAAKSAASSATPAKAPNKPALAYFMGRKFVTSCTFSTLKKPDEAAKATTESGVFATGLELTPLTVCEGLNETARERVKATAEEIKKKHGDAAAASFQLGAEMSDAFFGAALDAPIGSLLPDMEAHATAAAVPDAVWKAHIETCKTKVTSDEVDALAKGLDAHFKSL